MSLSKQEIRTAATDLLNAEMAGRQIGLLTLRHPDLGMDDAYAIQDELIRMKVTRGRSVVGWKIGLTSRAMQQALGIDIPDSGVLLDDMVFDRGAAIPPGRFIQPRIEAEIAFVTKTPLEGDNVTTHDILEATDHVVPALEILDTRILRKDPRSGAIRKVFDTIADNAANAGVVLGDRTHSPNDFDLRWVGAIVQCNDTVEETGLGAGVLGDPLESMTWLVRRLAAYGQRIEAGQIVLSGSFIRPIECPPGTDIRADFGAFGEVNVTFSQSEFG